MKINYVMAGFCLLTLTACVAASPANDHAANPSLPSNAASDNTAASVVGLSPAQLEKLRGLLGLEPSSPFTVEVIDQDNSRGLSVGDIAVMIGGIANSEVGRRILDANDIAAINTK